MAVIDFLLKRFRFLKVYYKPVYGVILSVFLIVSASAVGIKYYQKSKECEEMLKTQYMRAVSDVAMLADNIEINLTKTLVATEPKEISKLANLIYTDASIARLTLGQIPSYEGTLSGVSKFLSQIGDYTASLSLSHIDGGSITQQEYDVLESFVSNAAILSDSLSKLEGEIYGGRVSLFDITNQSREVFENKNEEFSSHMQKNETHFASLPSLIYDGPYSDHIKDKKSALLDGKSDISKEEAQKAAEDLFGKKFKGEIHFSGETGGTMPTYNFTAIPASDTSRMVSVEFTKQGGAISLILDNRFVPHTKIDISAAKHNAASFLARYEFGKMRDTYYEISDNAAIINYAAVQEGVTCYPDLVKVKIALDNGEMLGIECSGYIANHKKRDLPPFSHTEEEIKSKLSPKVTSEKITKCIIPTASKNETACYEVLCKYKDKTFLVYLNAQTLKEENILMLIETEQGSLTI